MILKIIINNNSYSVFFEALIVIHIFKAGKKDVYDVMLWRPVYLSRRMIVQTSGGNLIQISPFVIEESLTQINTLRSQVEVRAKLWRTSRTFSR